MNFLSLNPDDFGMDFSDLSIRIAKLEKRGKFFNLASWNETELPPGIIQNGEVENEAKLTAAIRKSLDNVKGERIKTKYVIVSLPEKKAFLQVIEVPKMNEEELKNAIPFEVENYVPLLSTKMYLDYRPILSDSLKPGTMNVLSGASAKINY